MPREYHGAVDCRPAAASAGPRRRPAAGAMTAIDPEARCIQHRSRSNASSPGTSSRPATCCPPPTARARPWRTSWPAPTPDLRRRWETLTLGYTESQGLPELREAIAGMYDAADADQVLVAAPEEAIFLAMHALLSPGDHVVCTFPGYQSLYELARSIGCEVDLWEPEEIGTGAGGRRDGRAPLAGASTRPPWRRCCAPTTKLVVWNFPHNPTGALPSAADFARMVDAVARRRRLALLRRDVPAARARARSCACLPRWTSTTGRSRWPGCRRRSVWPACASAGWRRATRRLLERMTALKDYTTICSSAPERAAGPDGAALPGAHPGRQPGPRRAEHARRRRTSSPGMPASFSWAPPQAGTVCFPRLLAGCAGSGGRPAAAAPRPSAPRCSRRPARCCCRRPCTGTATRTSGWVWEGMTSARGWRRWRVLGRGGVVSAA